MKNISFLLIAVGLALWCTDANARSTKVQDFLSSQSHRYQGTLVSARYSDYDLRRVPYQRLDEDLRRLAYSIKKYTLLNQPHMPSMAGPVVLMVAGGIGILGAFIYLTSSGIIFRGGFEIFSLIALAGVAVLLAGGIWLAVQIARRRRTPYHKKLRQLKIIRKAIIQELRNRNNRYYGLHLPRVGGRPFAFAF